jgi:hypothetical protein
MPKKKSETHDQIISAQVILRPRGKDSSHGLAITSANIAELAPDAGTASRIARYFREKGFDSGEMAGTSFSISAPASTFERTFGTSMSNRKELALPMKSLDADVAREIEEVTFTPPPDFGPTSY